MNKSKLLQLARLVMKFAEVTTDKGSLIYDGELIVGTEVSVENEDGSIADAPDGDYVAEDGTIIKVAEGKVTEIIAPEVEDVEPIEEELEEEEPVEEPEEDKTAELEAKIAELEALIEEKDKLIQELTDKLAEKPVEEPIQMSQVVKQSTDKKNGALKYFQD